MEIYVGNLAYATTDDGLKAAFAQAKLPPFALSPIA